MYPLLIAAVSSATSTLIDKITTPAPPKVAAPAENFAATLQKSAAANTPAAQIASLRQRLIESPEVATLLASADPAKQPALSLSPDGTLTARTLDGRTSVIPLSPDTAATARQLAALSVANSVPGAVSAGKNLPVTATAIPIR